MEIIYVNIVGFLLWCAFLARGRICNLRSLLGLASAISLGSQSRGTRAHISLSQFWDSINLKDQVRVFISARKGLTQLYPGRWARRPQQSQSYLTTDGQSASLSCDSLPILLSLSQKLSTDTCCSFSMWRPVWTRGRVWNVLVQILLDHGYAVTLVSKSRRTSDHILLSHLRPGSLSVASYVS
jgi:hypothetical protein